MNNSPRFEPLQERHFPLLHRWLNAPHVLRWYSRQPFSPEEVLERYGPKVRGEVPARPFLILLGDTPIGYIQTYRIREYPEYARSVAAVDDAAGVDLFIGEEAHVHRGLGPSILRSFLREIVFPDLGVESCLVGPDPDNRAAIRAYEKAGFRYLKTIRPPGEDGPEYLMRITRTEVFAP